MEIGAQETSDRCQVVWKMSMEALEKAVRIGPAPKEVGLGITLIKIGRRENACCFR